MQRLFILGLVLFTSASVQAQDKPGSATRLSPALIEQGWIQLFDGDSTYGWKIEGEAKVEGGKLVLGGSKLTRAETTTRFGPYSISFSYSYEGPEPAEFLAPNVSTSLVPNKNASVDQSQLTAEPRTPFLFRVPAGGKLALTAVHLQPGNLKSIFNGKDLAGWKVFPGKKSSFTVTDKGELNVKNGSGDLQTEGKWGDFVLQLQCISNGEHLNSGVFFRCRPNEYQNGYEAQIRNQFTAEPKQVYTIEEYDPGTHKLSGKTKVKATAVDYGTGAIYRRQPARRQMSKDHEWFSMTVLALGNHFATWVNGIQVTDWTDNRPLSDNARTGCRLEAGHISLQGHDPTTNLSFKNMRIAELARSPK
jgi:hypothetical protein